MTNGMKTSEFWIMLGAFAWFVLVQLGITDFTHEQAAPIIEGAKTTADKVIAAADKLQQAKESSGGWEPMLLSGLWLYLRQNAKKKSASVEEILQAAEQIINQQVVSNKR